MPSTAQMIVIGYVVIARTLCATTVFFLRSPGPRAGSRPPSSCGPASARARGSSRTLLASGWPGRRLHWPARPSSLPPPRTASTCGSRLGRIELATELGQRLLAGQDSLHRLPLELRAEDTPAVGLPPVLAHAASRRILRPRGEQSKWGALQNVSTTRRLTAT